MKLHVNIIILIRELIFNKHNNVILWKSHTKIKFKLFYNKDRHVYHKKALTQSILAKLKAYKQVIDFMSERTY